MRSGGPAEGLPVAENEDSDLDKSCQPKEEAGVGIIRGSFNITHLQRLSEDAVENAGRNLCETCKSGASVLFALVCNGRVRLVYRC